MGIVDKEDDEDGGLTAALVAVSRGMDKTRLVAKAMRTKNERIL